MTPPISIGEPDSAWEWAELHPGGSERPRTRVPPGEPHRIRGRGRSGASNEPPAARPPRRRRGAARGVARDRRSGAHPGNRATDALTLADAGRLASRSRLEADPQLALLMAREAVNIDDSPETRSALFAALQRTPAIRDRIYPPGGTSAAGRKAVDRDLVGREYDRDRRRRTERRGHRCGEQGAHRRRRRGIRDRTCCVQPGREDPCGGDVDRRPRIDRCLDPLRTRSRLRGGLGRRDRVRPRDGKLLTAEHDASRREFLVPRDPVTLEPTGRRVVTPGRNRVGSRHQCSARRVRHGVRAGRQRGRDDAHGPTLLWDPRLTVVRRYAIGAQAVAVSPDGDVAALIENGDDDYTRHRFVLEPADRRSANRVGRASGASKTAYEAVGATFTPDGRSVVTVGNDSRLLVWDVATAHVRTTLAQTGDIPLRGPVLSPDGTTAYATDRNRDVVVWDLSGNHRLDRPFTAGTGWPGWPWFAMTRRPVARGTLPRRLRPRRHGRVDRDDRPPRRASHPIHGQHPPIVGVQP